MLKKDVELGFTLLADIPAPAFHKPEFERIRSQILGEMASDNDDPGHVAMKSFNQLVFHGHPYRWPLYGSEESLSKIAHADVVGFYNRESTLRSDDSDDRGRRHDGTGDWTRADPFRCLEEGWNAAA